MKREGFTLIELMITIAIIAILTTVAIGTYGRVQSSGRDTKRKQDIDAISKVLEGKFDSFAAKYSGFTGNDFSSGSSPTDPQGISYTYSLDGAAATTVVPAPSTTFGIYVVCAKLETNTGNSSDTNDTAATSGGYYCLKSQQ